MTDFDHEKLDVYVAAIDFVALADEIRRLGLVEDSRYVAGRELLLRVVAMLVQMVRRLGESGTGSGTGSGTK
jgi:hypothetical protein